MTTWQTASGYFFREIEPAEAKQLEVGEEVCIGLKTVENGKTTLELIPAVVTKSAYYNADCDEPGWEIETNEGATDLYSLYTRPEQ